MDKHINLGNRTLTYVILMEEILIWNKLLQHSPPLQEVTLIIPMI